MSTSDTLVIATKDRPDDLRVLLALLASGTRVPQKVLVIDAGNDERAMRVCREAAAKAHLLGRLVYVRARRAGLPSQRNEALEMLGTDLVHFLDDDSRPALSYFETVVDFFERDVARRVGGVTGLVTNPVTQRRCGLLHRVFLLAPEQGTLNGAGRNAVVRTGTVPFQVDCLSGCSMSFRREVFERLRFDESLERGLTGGYALGEDLDLSLRLRPTWQSWCLPAAQLRHEESPVNRSKRVQYDRAASAFRRRLAEDPSTPVRWHLFWWSTVGDVALSAANRFVGRDPDGLRVAAAKMRGAVEGQPSRDRTDPT